MKDNEAKTFDNSIIIEDDEKDSMNIHKFLANFN